MEGRMERRMEGRTGDMRSARPRPRRWQFCKPRPYPRAPGSYRFRRGLRGPSGHCPHGVPTRRCRAASLETAGTADGRREQRSEGSATSPPSPRPSLQAAGPPSLGTRSGPGAGASGLERRRPRLRLRVSQSPRLHFRFSRLLPRALRGPSDTEHVTLAL